MPTPRTAIPPPTEPGQFLVLAAGGIHKYHLDSDLATELWPQPGATVAAQGTAISPDGEHVAFMLFDGNEYLGRGDLWVMANDGSGIRGVSAPPPEHTWLTSFAWSPDGLKLAYIAAVPYQDELVGEWYYEEVYVVDHDGANRRKISADVVEPVDADTPSDLRWSPDGRYVAWTVRMVEDGVASGESALDVHDVQAGGDNRVRLSSAAYEWAPDGTRIAYLKAVNGFTHLYTIRPDGTGVIKVNPDLALGEAISGRGVYKYAWAPDGSRIAYIADADSEGVWELYTVTPDGTGAAKVSGPLTGTTEIFHFTWSPDGTRIAYSLSGAPELYTVRPDGNELHKVSGPLDPEDSVHVFKWSPDAARLAYRAAASDWVDREYYVVRWDGTDLLKVEGVLPGEPAPQGKSQGWFSSQHFEWSPDSAYLAFVAIRDTPDVVELFTLRPDTGEYFKLNDPVTGPQDLRHVRFGWSRDGSRIAYGHSSDVYVVAPNGAAYRNVTELAGLTVGAGYLWSP